MLANRGYSSSSHRIQSETLEIRTPLGIDREENYVSQEKQPPSLN